MERRLIHLGGSVTLATKKVVQTELGQREYDLLLDVAKKEGLTIKEAARRALLEWSMSSMEMKEDALFKLKPVKFRTKIKTSEVDRFLYHAK
jgi:hypothetical protein